jgi:hypothetical protein
MCRNGDHGSSGASHSLAGSVTSRAVTRSFPQMRPGFDPRSGRTEFVVDKAALGQGFSEYFRFPCQFSFHRLLHTHHLSSGAGTVGQLVTDVSSGLSLSPPDEFETLVNKRAMT